MLFETRHEQEPVEASLGATTSGLEKAHPGNTGESPLLGRQRFVLLFGVFAPTAILVVELLFGVCRRHFFDPVPTPWHAILVLCGVACAAFVAFSSERVLESEVRRRSIAAALGFSTVIAAYYGILAVPLVVAAVCLLPISLLQALHPLSGDALILLAPAAVFSVPMAWLACRSASVRWSAQLATPGPRRVRRYASMVGILVLVVLELPYVTTSIGIASMIARGTPETKVAAERWLARFGSERELAAAASGRRSPGRATGGRAHWSLFLIPNALQSRNHRISPSEFWQVTGKAVEDVDLSTTGRQVSIRSESIQRNATPLGRVDWPIWGTDQDAFRSTDVVGYPLPGLGLAESVMVAHVEAESAVARIGWTLEFENAHDEHAREARARIRLPPRAVVSRVTAWVAGEPRDAVFGPVIGVAKDKDDIVPDSAARVPGIQDPLIVRWEGPDRVSIRCSPVPAKGRMKILLGITTPCAIRSPEEIALSLPRFVEQNFSDAKGGHHVEIRSTSPIAGGQRVALTHDAPRSETTSDGLEVVRWTLPGEILARGDDAVVIARRGDVRSVRVSENENDADPASDPSSDLSTKSDSTKSGSSRIVAMLERTARSTPRRVVVVLDASAGIATSLEPIARAFEKTASPGIEWQVLVAGADETPRHVCYDTNPGREIAKRIRRVEAWGGKLHRAILTRLWNELGPLTLTEEPSGTEARETPDGGGSDHGVAILWIHVGQPSTVDRSSFQLVDPGANQAGTSGERQTFDAMDAWRIARTRGLRIFEYQVNGGHNVVLEDLARVANVEAVPRTGSIERDLVALLEGWAGKRSEWRWRFEKRSSSASLPNEESTPTSRGLFDLFVAEKVAIDRFGPEEELRNRATALAIEARIVTPVSVAVVPAKGEN
jgi:hypothetical protein